MSDAHARLEKMVEYSCKILRVRRPIHAVIRGAADKEAFSGKARCAALTHDRLSGQTTERVTAVPTADTCAQDSTVAEAPGQRYCALASPELYYLLTVELGWTADKHRKWLTNLLQTELLRSVEGR